MKYSYRITTTWKDNNYKAIRYGNLTCNNEKTIIEWLYQQGVGFKGAWGQECHDIGETDFFEGSITTDAVDAIIAFLGKIYGEWSMDATYKGTKIRISKMYPNIMHDLGFRYSGEQDEMMRKLFEKFEREFCYPEIKESKQYR